MSPKPQRPRPAHSPSTNPRLPLVETDLPSARRLELKAAADLEVATQQALPSTTPYLPPTTQLDQRNTSRLLPARYSDSVLTRLADSNADLQVIYELDSATNDRLLAEAGGGLGIYASELVCTTRYARIIHAAFAHPHPMGARFSTAQRGAWYAGFDLATAKAEVLFHRSVSLSEIHWEKQEDLEYDHYLADFSGPFHDLRASLAEVTHYSSLEAARLACLAPDSYVASQQLAVGLLALESFGIVYPSARRDTGTCIACFRPALVRNVRKRELLRLSWFPDKPARFTRVARTRPDLNLAPSPKASE